ncbi:hypothetical protein DOTSEDRAFT_46279, partial [Dothistroma septosporum NZE10]
LLDDKNPPPTYNAQPHNRALPSLHSDSDAEASMVSPLSAGANVNDPASGSGQLVIAIDHGTTFTGVTFTTTHSEHADLAKISVLMDWTPKVSNQQKFRSVISCASPTQEWDSDISEDAVTTVRTKLELEHRNTRLAEVNLTLRILRGSGCLGLEHIRKSGPSPAFATRTPVQTVTDYLTEV